MKSQRTSLVKGGQQQSSSIPPSPPSSDDDIEPMLQQAQSASASIQPTWAARVAMRTARSRWFIFLRRVFHYQNGGGGVVEGGGRYSNNNNLNQLGSNPFNSGRWMVIESVTVTAQICLTWLTLMVSREEKPMWPMRVWVVGYDIGCFISLVMLYWRYRANYVPTHHRHRRDLQASHYNNNNNNNNGSGPPSTDQLQLQPRTGDENSRVRERELLGTWSQMISRTRTSLDLYYAMWFVMGNVWVFDVRISAHESFARAPRLHLLCVALLAWNAVCYAFPFLLFLLLCVVLPLLSGLIGYNVVSLAAAHSKGASDEQISALRSWRLMITSAGAGADHRQLQQLQDLENNNNNNSNEMMIMISKEFDCCCICLANYKDKEEIRQLPCSHIFHQKCVDQWLRIISCCPLCKQGLDDVWA